MATPLPRRPLRVPFLRLVPRLVLVLLVAAATVLLAGYQLSRFGFGRDFVSVTSYSSYGLPVGQSAEWARPGVDVLASELSYLDGSPTAAQRVLEVLTAAPSLVVADGVIVLLWVLLWRARHGVHRPRVAGLLRGLGWWLFAGGVAAAAVQEFARLRLLESVALGESPSFGLRELEPAWLLAGLALLVVGHMLRDATRMREDLEGTV